MYVSEKKEVNVIITIIIIIEYTGICIYKQSFEYNRVFNMLDIKQSLGSYCTRYLALPETEACSELCQRAKMALCGRIITFN